MERFTTLRSRAVILPQPNIDTDQILPARFLQKQRSGGFGQYLFHDLRFDSNGQPIPDFPLHQNPQARILIAGANFGCGSSRENAVWAIHDYGFRAVIAPSFGDIFYNNSLKNGLLPVALPHLGDLSHRHEGEFVVDLEQQQVTLPDGSVHPFTVDPFGRHCLLKGLDELDYTLSRMEEILAFERRYETELL